MRSKYGTYPEYHTSLDDLDLVTPAGLQGGYAVLKNCLEVLEKNKFYRATCLGEPQLSKRGLYPCVGTRNLQKSVRLLLDFIAYSDGVHDLIAISNMLQVPINELYEVVDKLQSADLITEIEENT